MVNVYIRQNVEIKRERERKKKKKDRAKGFQKQAVHALPRGEGVWEAGRGELNGGRGTGEAGLLRMESLML